MTEDLKQMILKAGEVLQSFGASEVFFFGSVTRTLKSDHVPLDLAVAGLPPEVFYQAMGEVLRVIKRRCNLVDLDEDSPYVRYLRSYGKMQVDLYSKMKNEMRQLHQLLESYNPLIDAIRFRGPSKMESTALAGVIQLFYTGLDKIFRRIIAEYDHGFETGYINDIEVLERLALSTPGRSAVLGEMVVKQLLPYLSFRQVFTTSCMYEMKWSKFRDLIFEAEEILLLVEADLTRFIEG